MHAQVTGRRGAHARTKANIAEAVRRGIPLRAGMVDVAGREHAMAGRAELTALGVTRVSAPDRVRSIGRAAGAGAGGGDVAELCGRCGRGMAAVSPDGDVWPCVMSRWLPAGNVLREGLGTVLAGQRWQAVVAGIPAPRAGACNPDDDKDCNPKQDGNDCKPAETPACVPKYEEDSG